VVTAEQRGEILAMLRRKAPVTAARLERQWREMGLDIVEKRPDSLGIPGCDAVGVDSGSTLDSDPRRPGATQPTTLW